MNRQDQIEFLRKALKNPHWEKPPEKMECQAWQGKEASDYLSSAYRALSTKPNFKADVIDPMLPEDLEEQPED